MSPDQKETVVLPLLLNVLSAQSGCIYKTVYGRVGDKET